MQQGVKGCVLLCVQAVSTPNLPHLGQRYACEGGIEGLKIMQGYQEQAGVGSK